MNTTTKDRYDAVSIALHWLAAVAVVAAFALGPGDFGRFAGGGGDPGTRIDIVAHESIGVLVFLLTALRLGWMAVRPAKPPASGPGWSHLPSVAVQTLLWVLLLATPATAILTLAGEGQPLTLLAGLRLESIPWVTGWAGTRWVDWGEVHTVLGDAMIWVAGLHAAAALVHHFLWKDSVLRSMLPQRHR